MKGINLMLAGLLLLAMISGCPAAENGNGETTVPAGDTGSAAPAAAPFVESNLALDGIKLGANSEEFLARYAEETGAESYPMWAEENVLGIVRALLDPEVGEPVETCVFMESRLVGFTRMLTITAEDFEVLKAEMAGNFGDPTVEPPVWAQESDFYEGEYQPVPEDLDGSFWCDEEARVMLAMIYSEEEGAISANLIDLDRLNIAADATMEAMAPPEMGGMPMGAPPAEGEGEVDITAEEAVEMAEEEAPAEPEATEDVPEEAEEPAETPADG